MNHIEYCRQFLTKNSLILDVGSGKGKFLSGLAKAGYEVFGIEINAEYIRESRELAAREEVAINVSRASAEELPFKDNYFDFVNCSEVTEHVNDPRKVIREIFRVLKPGGKSYVSFHNRFGAYDYHYHLYFINWIPRSWTEPVLKILKRQKDDSNSGKQKLSTMHYYIFSDLKKILEEEGFIARDIREDKLADKFPYVKSIFLPMYSSIFRPVYFNTFHILLEKPLK